MKWDQPPFSLVDEKTCYMFNLWCLTLCFNSGYLACARCSSTGALVLIEPVATVSGGNQPLSEPKTERCPNCSGSGKVSHPTLLIAHNLLDVFELDESFVGNFTTLTCRFLILSFERLAGHVSHMPMHWNGHGQWTRPTYWSLWLDVLF